MTDPIAVSSLTVASPLIMSNIAGGTTTAVSVSVRGSDGSAIVNVHPDGSVWIADGIDVDTAARAFYDALRRIGGTAAPQHEGRYLISTLDLREALKDAYREGLNVATRPAVYASAQHFADEWVLNALTRGVLATPAPDA